MQDQIKDNTFQIENIKNSITGIESKFTDLKDNYRLLYDGSKNQNDQLGNQISFSGYLMGVFSMIFAILGSVLAWYVNSQYKKIIEIRVIIENTKNYIDGHSIELYKKIKRDDTEYFLKRLQEVPEDINNIVKLLLSRDLLEKDFNYLRDAYLKIKNDILPQGKNAYMSLFMQHFPYQSLKNDDLRIDIISYINFNYINCMFERDIMNFFDQTFKYLQEFGINNEQSKNIIKDLFYHCFKSRFKLDNKLKNYIKNLFVKYQLDVAYICSIANEQTPKDATYTAWLDFS